MSKEIDFILSPQAKTVLKHLVSGKSLTQSQALRLYDIRRLPARVEELRKAGKDIYTLMIQEPNGKRVGQYHIIKSEKKLPVKKRKVKKTRKPEEQLHFLDELSLA